MTRPANLNPKYAEAWLNKGNALAIQGKYDESIRAYDGATRVDPNLGGAWNNKGLALGGPERPTKPMRLSPKQKSWDIRANLSS